MGTLSGKKVLITGGGQGLGAAMSRAFIEAGSNVAIHYFSSRKGAEELSSFASTKGVRATGFQADLKNEEESRQLVEDAAGWLGGIDVLVNNAGDLVARSLLPDLTTALWDDIFRINVSSLLWVTRAALPWLEKGQGGASIVNLSSVAGRKGGHPGSLAYSTAKGAVLTFTRALSTEVASRGIRVNAVAPGFILGSRFHETHTTGESARQTIKQIPLGRAGTPEDVARAVLFLAAEYDGFVHGATLDVNGGVYCA